MPSISSQAPRLLSRLTSPGGILFCSGTFLWLGVLLSKLMRVKALSKGNIFIMHIVYREQDYQAFI